MKPPILLPVGILVCTLLCALPLTDAQRSRSSRSSADNSRRQRLQEDGAGDYIVAYKKQPVAGTGAAYTDAESETTKVQVESSVASFGGEVTHSYSDSDAISGFAAKLTPQALKALQADPNVVVEPDSPLVMFTTQTGENVPWGIDRIDQSYGIDGNYTYEETGAGVHVYVIDTGISSTHTEFTGRLGEGYNAADSDSNPETWDDCQGHGTHVASTIGGTIYGVAKGVTLHAVRVLDCNGAGSVRNLLGGLNWILKQIKAIKGQKSVVNLSVGVIESNNVIVNLAVERLILNGALVVAAAGDLGTDACNISPASVLQVITTGATDIADTKWKNSDYGSCVDIYAPGLEILGAGIRGNDAFMLLSGTSMAAAHVSGVAALYFEKLNGGSRIIRRAILKNSAKLIVQGIYILPNRFLQSAVPPACKTSGKICKRTLCKASLSCCCDGLKCKGLGLGKCA